MGVEPTCRAWEARILPMNYSREKGMTQGSLASFLVGVTGLEPMASWSRTKRDTKLRHTPESAYLLYYTRGWLARVFFDFRRFFR